MIEFLADMHSFDRKVTLWGTSTEATVDGNGLVSASDSVFLTANVKIELFIAAAEYDDGYDIPPGVPGAGGSLAPGYGLRTSCDIRTTWIYLSEYSNATPNCFINAWAAFKSSTYKYLDGDGTDYMYSRIPAGRLMPVQFLGEPEPPIEVPGSKRLEFILYKTNLLNL